MQLVQIGNLAQAQQHGVVTFTISGSPDRNFTANANRADYTNENQYQWAGNIADLPGGYIGLVAEHGSSSGFIQLQGEFYTLYPLDGKLCILQQHQMSAYNNLVCANDDDVTEQGEEAEDYDPCEPAYNTYSANLTVLVLGTHEAMATFASPWNAVAMLGTAFLSISWAFQNSDIPNKQVRYHWENVDFELSSNNNIEEDKDHLISNAYIQGWRNYYAADIVVLLTDNRYVNAFGNPVFGIAGEILATQSNSYAIVAAPFLVDPRWTFAHEIGHLLGARHNTDLTNVCSHGFVFDDASGTERNTIMALIGSGNERVLHYSNPDVNFNGVASGDADHNNARVIRNHACKVANFRDEHDWSANLQGYTMLCDYSQPLVPRTYFANISLPSILGIGLPPYTYEWRWSESGILSTSDPGIYLGSESSVTIGALLSCPDFFLHMRVTSSEGLVITNTMHIDSGACYDCYYGGGKADLGMLHYSPLQASYAADMRQLYVQLPADFDPTTAVFTLYYLNGQSLKTTNVTANTTVIDVPDVPNGLYVGVLQNSQQVYSTKVFIAK